MNTLVDDVVAAVKSVESKPVRNDVIARQLRWRYATKKFDPAKKVSDADWQTLKEALLLAPSSFGLSPWKFVVAKDPEVRARLRDAAWGQWQVTDASHFVVLAVRKGVDAAYVDRFIERVAEVRGVSPESLRAYRDVMASFVSRDGFDVDRWSGRQVYIALGQVLETAALLGVDACPMEGFDPAQFDQILGLAGTEYTTLGAVALGYRAADDKYAGAAKVRFDEAEVLVEV